MSRSYPWYILLLGMALVLTLLALPITTPPVAAQPSTSTASTVNTARVDAFVRGQMQRHGIPGVALGIVEGDRIVHLQGFGTADSYGRPVTAQTPFILASSSKPITALAIMQLVEAGQVELNAPVQRYLPDFRVADPIASQQITVRHLLQHTSGIPVTACDTRVDAETLEQFVAELRTVELDAPVGTRHSYCSGNYNVLGRIIEVVAGQPFGAYLRQRVFTPLQMHNSYTSELDARHGGLVQNYRWFFGLLLPSHERYNSSQLPSGYIIASAEDMSHFLIAQLNGGRFGAASVLSPAGIDAMQAPGVPIGTGPATYGLGWRVEPVEAVPTIQHDGTHADSRAFLFMQPGTRRGAVLLLNANSTLLAELTANRELRDGMARLLTGQAPAPASSLSLRTLYLIVNAVLGGLLILALWPAVRLDRWTRRLEQAPAGQWRLLRIGLRLAWEFLAPLILLIGTWQLLRMLGAQSWAEGLATFPDLGLWLWVVSLLILATGATRLVLLIQVLRVRGRVMRTVRV